jgi:hypothetical protein
MGEENTHARVRVVPTDNGILGVHFLDFCVEIHQTILGEGQENPALLGEPGGESGRDYDKLPGGFRIRAPLSDQDSANFIFQVAGCMQHCLIAGILREEHGNGRAIFLVFIRGYPVPGLSNGRLARRGIWLSGGSM